MATFNKSEIFKSAWALVRTGKSLSEALKAAWASAKAPAIAYSLNANGSAVSNNTLTAVFELSFSQAKEREWVKKEGARWNAETKEWTLKTNACNIGASANYGLHIIPSHLVQIAKSIK